MNIGYKNRFRALFIIQLALTQGLLFAGIYTDAKGGYPVTCTLLLVLSLLSIIQLLRYVERHFHVIELFFSAAKNKDFSQKLGSSAFSKRLKEEFNALNDQYQKENAKRASENAFLRALIRQAPVAILAFDDMNRINLFNHAAAQLFNITAPSNTEDLNTHFTGFTVQVSSIPTGSRSLHKYQLDGIEHSLMISKARALLDDKQQTLITIENIGRELIDAEYMAWKNLISVLTHEVMNSVTPIVSLATTCKDILSQPDLLTLPEETLKEEISDASKAITTISGRSQGIMGFVDSYRKLAKLPEPQLTDFEIQTFYDEQKMLHDALLDKHAISLNIDVSPNTLKISADRHQLEQAFLNLLKNAIEALSTSKQKHIYLGAHLKTGNITLSIEDTGCGIAPELLNQIFVPFFTTKRHGSGIGMALTRQIMHAHGGQLSVRSKPNTGTRIELIF